MLPVLKQAGVVDSGGMGLMVVYRGMYAALTGEPVEAEVPGEAAREIQSVAKKVEPAELVEKKLKGDEPADADAEPIEINVEEGAE